MYEYFVAGHCENLQSQVSVRLFYRPSKYKLLIQEPLVLHLVGLAVRFIKVAPSDAIHIAIRQAPFDGAGSAFVRGRQSAAAFSPPQFGGSEGAVHHVNRSRCITNNSRQFFAPVSRPMLQLPPAEHHEQKASRNMRRQSRTTVYINTHAHLAKAPINHHDQ